MKDLKRKHYVVIISLLILISTNPSRSSFGSYLHQTGHSGIGRDFNGLIFSVYSDSNYDLRSHKSIKTYYIGVLGNFFKTPSI